jgi:hypothetical protein
MTLASAPWSIDQPGAEAGAKPHSGKHNTMKWAKRTGMSGWIRHGASSRELREHAESRTEGMTDAQCRAALLFLVEIMTDDRSVQQVNLALEHGRRQ